MIKNYTFIIDELILMRKAQGMTQSDLADVTNLTQSVIARFESKRTIPQLDTLLRIVNALSCELKVLPMGYVSVEVEIPIWLYDLAEKNNVNYSQLLENAIIDYLDIPRPHN